MIDINDSLSLSKAIEQIKPESRFLVDTFFPNIMPPALTKMVGVEYRKYGRNLAPYVVSGGHGVNIGRAGSIMKYYAPPLLGARRIVSPEDIEHRDFGEQPIYTTMTPAERASRIQSRDLKELSGMVENRKNQMASEILTTGKLTIKGYADDGVTPRDDSISFDWNGKMTPTIPWNNSNADILGDLERASEKIQEDAGQIPTVMIVGKNVARYLLKNAEILSWLSIPSRENFALMSMQPKLTSPQIMRIGLIQMLNLEIYSYFETYQDESGNLRNYIDDNLIIIGIPGFGSQLYGSITLLNNNGQFETYSTQLLPHYHANQDTQSLALTVYSRVILVPTVVDSWISMNVLDSMSSQENGSTSINSDLTGSDLDYGSEIAGSNVSLPGL